MSLMDDVFDLRDHLKDTPQAKLLDNIETRLWAYEEWIDKHKPLMQVAIDFKRLVSEGDSIAIAALLELETIKEEKE
jgi:hypothetical protein